MRGNIKKLEIKVNNLIKEMKEVDGLNFDNISDPSDELYEKVSEIIFIYKTIDF